MKIADIMTSDVSTVDLWTSVADAAGTMQTNNTGCLVVVEDGTLAGIITERDMVLGCLVDGHTSWKCQVYRHMTILCEAATLMSDVGDAMLVMMDNEVSYLPVVDDSRAVVGLLYAEDLSRAIEEEDPVSLLDSDLIPV